MKIIVVSLDDRADFLARSLGAYQIHAEIIRIEHAISQFESGINPLLVADAIVIDANIIKGLETQSRSRAERLAEELRNLPPSTAMIDGRKWNALPIVITANPEQLAAPDEIFGTSYHHRRLPEKPDDLIDTVAPYRETAFTLPDVTLAAGVPSELARHLYSVVHAYRARLIDQFDNIGFVIRHVNGTFRVGPALTTKHNINTPLYYGPADIRDSTKFYTVDRELVGIEYEIEQFEWLLNKPSVTEREIHEFLEAHPHFLSQLEHGSFPLSHPTLSTYDGRHIIPDFILRPGTAIDRDDRWQILDLKRPDVRLTSLSGMDARFSAKVYQAIQQLRRYRDEFANPANAEAIAAALGRAVHHPRLAVLIGRIQNAEELDALNNLQRDNDVRIVPYDELLEGQRAIYNIEASTQDE